MPRQSQPTRKNKPRNSKQPNAVKKASKDESRILDPQDRPSKHTKTDTTEIEDLVIKPATDEEKQGASRSKRQMKAKAKAKTVAGILSTQDSNVPSHDTSHQTSRRRSSRVVATKKGKPSYIESPSSQSTTEDDDSDDESNVSIASMPNSNNKNVVSGDKETKSMARGRKPAKTPLQHQRSSPVKSPRKKARVVSTVGTPLYSGVDIKKPSPASSSIKEITKNMWKENEGDWRVESAMDY